MKTLAFIGELFIATLITLFIMVNILFWIPLLSYSYHWWFS